MEIEFLGTGTSCGVPVIGCDCEVCKSTDARDNRKRASVIVRTDNGAKILIDCGPDFYSQMLRATDYHLDALLITHSHYDHVGGIDDLRPYCHPTAFPVYARRDVIGDLKARVPYCFVEKNKYPGVPTFDLHEVTNEPFTVCGVNVMPVSVWHYKLPIVGYRIGDFAYVTDAKTIEPAELNKLKGVKLLVINGLRYEAHMSHMTIPETLEVINQIKPERAFITHMSHDIGLHAEADKLLPEGVHFAYDGLIVRL